MPWRDEAAAILAYWFDELGKDRWWTRSDAVDETVRARFEGTWRCWREQPADAFLSDGDDAVAGVLLFDQFPRNMFRGKAEAFATDPLAIAIASGAIDAGLDAAMDVDRRTYLYMPFMHSEVLDDQERAILLFTALGLPEPLEFARKHHAVIEQFGRFPHRNAVLGRAMRAGEAAAAEEGRDW